VILADSSIWADHFRFEDPTLARLLDAGQVLMHPFVIGEVALGYLKQRDMILSGLRKMTQAPRASDDEVLHLINSRGLVAIGIGYIDAHLLAAVGLMPGSGLWTRDKKLHAAAERLGLAISPDRKATS
jgi:predicted nucleic acid-binding protein